ncbi:putative RING-H2 finger protein ATL50 [Brachypodium distachyon]|nr:putative RING-H2 finger protein ATL50 [Brachypodium distachyon]|eukprot:XP_010240306.2 putative RING-H2 finger protein ATL50 [Brachypodium distachyon]
MHHSTKRTFPIAQWRFIKTSITKLSLRSQPYQRERVVLDQAFTTIMAHPCSDHGYDLVALRRKLRLLLHLLDCVRFLAAVVLDRLGVLSCPDETLPGQPWAELVDCTGAMERLMEAAFREPSSKRYSSTAVPQYRRRRIGLAAEASEEYKGADDDEGREAVCAICLAPLQEAGGCQQQRVTELCSCSHAFHAACIDSWFASGEGDGAGTCPLCRTPTLPPAWGGWPEAVPHAS